MSSRARRLTCEFGPAYPVRTVFLAERYRRAAGLKAIGGGDERANGREGDLPRVSVGEGEALLFSSPPTRRALAGTGGVSAPARPVDLTACAQDDLRHADGPY